MKIVFFGEALVEINGPSRYQTRGGNVLNTALYLARLGESRSIVVSYATAIGCDKYSFSMLEYWQRGKIDTSLIRCFVAKHPGLCFIETDVKGHFHSHYWNGDNAARYYFSSGISPLEKALQYFDYHALYISGVSIAMLTEESKPVLIALIETFKKNGGKVYFDNRYRHQLWTTKQAQFWYRKILPLVDIAFIDCDDEHEIWGSSPNISARYSQFGCRELVLKNSMPSELGIHQSIIKNKSISEVTFTRTIKDEGNYILDNAFTAGYLAARIRGRSITEASSLGIKLARRVINYSDALIPYEAMRDIM